MKNFISIERLYELFIGCHQKITTDTRKPESGSIFFALRGENFDANLFASDAVKNGCAYAVVDNAAIADGNKLLLVENVLETLQNLARYHRKQLKYPVIGITGSNAKTTHKELIHAVLSQKYKVYATKGNLNNHIGVPLTILALTREHELAIVEMGANHQGEIALLSDIADPDFGIITNIGRAHLEGFGGEDGIKKGKGELFTHIAAKRGKLFVNGDDKVLMEMSQGLNRILYGENKEYEVHGKSYENSEYVEFKWGMKEEDLNEKKLVKTQMFGHYNFINLMCAVCVGNYFGVSEPLINKALEEYVPEMNRSQVKQTGNNTLILDAYNANPSSMKLAVQNFIKQPFAKKMCVLGDMLELGEFSNNEHQNIIDSLVGQNIENVYFVGPAFFHFKHAHPQFHFFETIEKAEECFKQQHITGKTILIKGSRGIKLEKLVNFL